MLTGNKRNRKNINDDRWDHKGFEQLEKEEKYDTYISAQKTNKPAHYKKNTPKKQDYKHQPKREADKSKSWINEEQEWRGSKKKREKGGD